MVRQSRRPRRQTTGVSEIRLGILRSSVRGGGWPKANAFRKFRVAESYELKSPRLLDRIRLHESRPTRDGLPDCAWTGARPARAGQTAAHERAATAHDLRLLLIGKDVVEGSEHQPYPPHDVQQVAEADTQRRDRAGGRPGAFGRQDGTRQHERGDFLRPGFDGVTLQHRGATQLPCQFPEIQLVFPPIRIDARQFERGGRGGIAQTGPPPQLVRAVTLPPNPHANLADFEPLDHAGRSVGRPDGKAHEPCTIGEPPNKPRLDRPRGAQQDVTADAPARHAGAVRALMIAMIEPAFGTPSVALASGAHRGAPCRRATRRRAIRVAAITRAADREESIAAAADSLAKWRVHDVGAAARFDWTRRVNRGRTETTGSVRRSIEAVIEGLEVSAPGPHLVRGVLSLP